MVGLYCVLTPPQQIIPYEVLLLRKHSHDDERVQVDALAQHPEVVAAHQVHVDEHDDLTARLEGRKKNKKNLSTSLHVTGTRGRELKALTDSLTMDPCFFSHTTVMTEFSTKEKKRFLWSVIRWQLRLLRGEERHIERNM